MDIEEGAAGLDDASTDARLAGILAVVAALVAGGGDVDGCASSICADPASSAGITLIAGAGGAVTQALAGHDTSCGGAPSGCTGLLSFGIP